jgi:hypothetical protein
MMSSSRLHPTPYSNRGSRMATGGATDGATDATTQYLRTKIVGIGFCEYVQ